jgi:hypothetical protein
VQFVERYLQEHVAHGLLLCIQASEDFDRVFRQHQSASALAAILLGAHHEAV